MDIFSRQAIFFNWTTPLNGQAILDAFGLNILIVFNLT